jgi:hypothetical protein
MGVAVSVGLVLLCGVLTLLLRPVVARGDVRLGAPFGDGMVLQQGVVVTIPGQADPGTRRVASSMSDATLEEPERENSLL